MDMCDRENLSKTDPTQWNEDCVFGTCKNCLKLEIIIPEEKKKQIITYSQWKYEFDEKKKQKQLKKNPTKKNEGKVFGLFDVTETVTEAVNNFLSSLPKMKVHIYVAYSQQNAHACNRENLDELSCITLDDDQQNLEVVHMENPTSIAYPTNKITMALYPICIEYKVNGVYIKGQLFFLVTTKTMITNKQQHLKGVCLELSDPNSHMR